MGEMGGAAWGRTEPAPHPTSVCPPPPERPPRPPLLVAALQIPGHQEGAESAAPLPRPPQVPRPLPRELGLWQHAFPVASVVRLGVAPQEKKDPLSQRNRLAPLRSAHLSAATPVHSEAQSESRGQRVQPLHPTAPSLGAWAGIVCSS